jgi:hypothetical protein
MGRTKGSLNKQPKPLPDTTYLAAEQRVKFLAQIIIERIQDDLKNDKKLLKKSQELKDA